MALNKLKGNILSRLIRLADSFNSPVTMQAANGESIDVSASDYTDADGFALYVGTGGDVSVQLKNGGDVTFKNIPNGMWMPISASVVNSTGTTASDIIAIK